ncbi:hypothetical protein AUJ66_08020 [Candidatus Desantisbacteria bacterium CG1_02_38_46]|uniref:Uncharacterized protein n=3 Tax=unclassified Candidatus Desantisiibacteriota TaxID=3106372 RepID=A0A2H9P9I4_9BACT|nr:MAG: hypothetical protein AUJ66_08020 [Candidatus Desantisbacteria bacterium CG1_02_38_46]PIU51687.1 MAG: hypothetical protein COS91_02995 [Candidatus Desantisbacteria bacterium CG07_land_8_20_14_0_80_39_15]PIZ14968.1 MAG: hypothetical protein COY51_06810 [Candidatus Desantisbacteria bacterium CG_4_10_14_0_8_um_filter_39_17]
MIRFLWTFPLFLLLLLFLFVIFLGILFVFLFLIRRPVYSYYVSGGKTREIIDLKEQKKKKWIAILALILIVAGLILLNYLKIDKNGKIYWEKKEKIQEQDYI